MKTKTASVRLDQELFEEIDNRCEKEACSRNDFIKNAINLALEENQSDLQQSDKAQKEEHKVIFNTESNGKNLESHYDKYGNYWSFNKDSKKWLCHINMDNVSVKP